MSSRVCIFGDRSKINQGAVLIEVTLKAYMLAKRIS
jgi:hypothetical protein